MKNRPDTFLVTGALGCIGAWTLYHLIERGKQVISFDISTDRHRLDYLLGPSEQEAITFLQGDVADTDHVRDVFAQHDITHVIHLAALQVPACKARPATAARVNVVGTVNVFEAARHEGVEHVAYASSVAVYGPASEYASEPVSEAAAPAPRTMYGVYKVANEGAARLYWQDYQMSSTALRPYTIYGVGRDQGLTSDPTKAMRAAARGEAFEIGFSGTMQFQWASDVAQQFIDAAMHPLDGAYVFNLGTAPATVDEVIALIQAVAPEATIRCADRTLPFPEQFADAKLRNHLPRVYETPLADGIRQTIEHFKRYPNSESA